MPDVNDQIKSEALNWLVSLRGTAEKAQAFALDQTPDVLRDLVTIGRLESTACVIFGMVFMLVAVGLMRWASRQNFSEWDGDAGMLGFFLSVLGIGIGVIAGLVMICNNFHNFVTAWFAPRIYIIETLTNLIGKAVGH
jgi:hypothetical protein